jgi:hypothetical protein
MISVRNTIPVHTCTWCHHNPPPSFENERRNLYFNEVRTYTTYCGLDIRVLQMGTNYCQNKPAAEQVSHCTDSKMGFFVIRVLNIQKNVGSEVPTTMVMKNSIFWETAPCSLLKFNQRFGGECRLHLQDRRIRQAKNQFEADTKHRKLVPWRWR